MRTSRRGASAPAWIRSTRSGTRLLLLFVFLQKHESEQYRADRHRAVRHVERPESDRPQPDVDEVDDNQRRPYPVDEIARGAAPAEAERQRFPARTRLTRAMQPPEDDQRERREGAEDDSRPRAERHAERRTGIIGERKTH